MYVEGAPAGVDVSIMVAAAVLTVTTLTIRPRPSNVVSYRTRSTVETSSMFQRYKDTAPALMRLSLGHRGELSQRLAVVLALLVLLSKDCLE